MKQVTRFSMQQVMDLSNSGLAIYPIVSIGSNLSMPRVLIGLLLPVQYNFVVYIGIGLYSLSVLFSLVTLPVEFNASSRALRYIGG